MSYYQFQSIPMDSTLFFRFDGNKVYLKDNFYYDTQYDHDGDANTAVVPAIRGFGDLSYHSNGNAQYTQEAARFYR